MKNRRRWIIAWLNNAKQFKNSNILEIGRGTVTSTVVLSKQGVIITVIYIDKIAIIIAKDRYDVYGLQVDFYLINATDVNKTF